MKKILQIFLRRIFQVFPLTRFFWGKAFFLRMSGIDCASSARVVSSFRFLTVGSLHIGEDTFIGHEVMIIGGDAAIHIGANCDIAPRVTIVTGGHEIDMAGLHSAGKGISKPIMIDDGVWIGACSVILGGCTVGRKSIIAAGSVVTQDIPPYVIAAGVPCRPVKMWDTVQGAWLPI